jgi:hypothetical protein
VELIGFMSTQTIQAPVWCVIIVATKLEEKNNFPMRGVNLVHPPEESSILTVEQGLDFMLAHFQEPLWPRNVSTAATRNAQKVVDSRDRAILYFEGALRADCRLAIYSNYQELAKLGHFPLGYLPKATHLFIDLDLASFAGDKDKLELALRQTKRKLARQLNGAMPTILWSGGGYHIHQPLEPAAIPVFEELLEFKRFENPNVQFMRYAEQTLSGGKADHNHKISFASSMARIPGSKNSKYEGDIAKVKIVQAWNGVRAKPTPQFMLTDFLIWLVQADLYARERMRKQAQRNYTYHVQFGGQGIAWIDRLLQTGTPDWRKTAVALILAPYLLMIKRMSYEQAYYTIMQWAARCAQLSSLRPNERGFVDRVHTSLERAQSRQLKPLRWSTLVQNYSAIYEALKQAS